MFERVLNTPLFHTVLVFNSFHAFRLFLYSQKSSENLWFSDVCIGYRKEISGIKCVNVSNLNLSMFASCMIQNFTDGLNKSSGLEVYYKKRVLRSFAKFTGKYLCQSLFFKIRVLKKRLNIGVFLLI